tara:strand:+ start:3566 stop:4174 length:609 start_codon:yes stop_codon:yes gene_type:complete
MSNKKIAWERWDEDVLEQEIVEDFYENHEDAEDEESVEDALAFLGKIPSLVTTPMGMYQLHDKMSVLNQFDCWMGYTNFDITKSVQEAIEKLEGVELLSIMTRYRFFLGVGKMFEFSDVRKLIETTICGFTSDPALDEDTKESIDLIKSSISSDRYWTIFVSQSGEISYASTNKDSDEIYLSKLNHYRKRKKKNGGFIFQND